MMKYRFLYILLIVAVCLCSCKKKEQVIPRSKMAKIYAEMFITDQQLTGQPSEVRAKIDTSWIYEPIFEKYGYTSDDYRASMAYYIQDANRYSRIVRKSAAIIEGEIKELKRQKSLLEKLVEVDWRDYRPERIFYLTGIDNPNLFGNDTIRFYVDSTGGQHFFDPRDWADTAYYGPVVRVRGEEIPDGEEVQEYTEGSGDSEDTKVLEDSGGSETSEEAGGDSEESHDKTVGGNGSRGNASFRNRGNSGSKAIIEETGGTAEEGKSDE